MIHLFRALVYAVTLLLVLWEPAVSVSFDRLGMGLFLVLIPLSALLALVREKRNSMGKGPCFCSLSLYFPDCPGKASSLC